MSRVSDLLAERDDLTDEWAASGDPAERADLLREIHTIEQRLFAAGYTPEGDQ